MRTLKRSECVVTSLVLTHEWYDMIDKGPKREEYRADTKRYETRFTNILIYSTNVVGEKLKEKVVAFQRAYNKPSMFWVCDIDFRRVGMARHPEWGEPDEPHWVLKLIERVDLVDDCKDANISCMGKIRGKKRS